MPKNAEARDEVPGLNLPLGEMEKQRGRPRLHRYRVPVRGLHPAHEGLRIAHLSDLHVGILTNHAFIRAAIQMAKAESPDLVLMTGDYVCYSPKFVGLLGEIVSGLTVPTVCVLGNHDYWTWGHGVAAQLQHQQYDVLRNQHTQLILRGEPLVIVGVDDAATRQADVERAFAGVPPHLTKLVLSHVPSTFDAIARHAPALTLSGHTHGGHVQIKGVTDRLFRKLGMPYIKGFYRQADSLLYVNCGVGSSSVPIRAGAPSEVAILTLHASP